MKRVFYLHHHCDFFCVVEFFVQTQSFRSNCCKTLLLETLWKLWQTAESWAVHFWLLPVCFVFLSLDSSPGQKKLAGYYVTTVNEFVDIVWATVWCDVMLAAYRHSNSLCGCWTVHSETLHLFCFCFDSVSLLIVMHKNYFVSIPQRFKWKLLCFRDCIIRDGSFPLFNPINLKETWVGVLIAATLELKEMQFSDHLCFCYLCSFYCNRHYIKIGKWTAFGMLLLVKSSAVTELVGAVARV